MVVVRLLLRLLLLLLLLLLPLPASYQIVACHQVSLCGALNGLRLQSDKVVGADNGGQIAVCGWTKTHSARADFVNLSWALGAL